MPVEKKIIVVGYGNQARAWCANLMDSGWQISVLLRPGSPSKALLPSTVKLVDWGSSLNAPLALLVPDHEIPEALASLSSQINPGTLLYYAHGFAPIEGKLPQRFPQFHHVLLAPKAIGTEVRATYLEKRALGGVYSVTEVSESYRAQVESFTLELAQGLGITWGPFPVSMHEEMVADLFSEQAVLCSVIPESCRLAFNMLIEKGVSPELAYFELWHEIGLIVRAMVERGPEAFFHLISPNALIGAEKGRQLLCGPEFQQGLKQLLQDIEAGRFAQEASQVRAKELRAKTIRRWQEDPFGQTIQRMQQHQQKNPK